jgi:transketolase
MFDVKKIRQQILTMAYTGQSVHIGCAFSLVEIFAVLYRDFFRVDNCENLILLSKGHGVMAQYVCLAELNIIPEEDIKNYFKNGSNLMGLAEAKIPGIHISSGSLGHGLSVAVGLALSEKLKKSNRKIFCIVGDGEANEGSIWEAIMFASHNQLNNLFVIIDCNKFQAMGETKDVLNMLSLHNKFTAFGFDCLEIDGHDEDAITKSIKKLNDLNTIKPKVIVANTIKGKGVSFMEHNNMWHYTRLNEETYNRAISELKA